MRRNKSIKQTDFQETTRMTAMILVKLRTNGGFERIREREITKWRRSRVERYERLPIWPEVFRKYLDACFFQKIRRDESSLRALPRPSRGNRACAGENLQAIRFLFVPITMSNAAQI